jgi:predicted transcriptional regulator
MRTKVVMASTDTPVPEMLSVLVQRGDFLQCILDEPREKAVLAEELGVSRSTVDRATSKLETMDLVRSGDEGYRTTSTGRLVTTDFFEFVTTLSEGEEDSRVSSDVPPLDLLDTVARRIELLESLRERPKDKRTLVDELGMSRSTVDRGVRELEAGGLIVYSDDRFTLTSFGQLVASELFGLLDTLELRRELDPFLKWIPDGTLDIDPDLLADAKVFLPESGDPWAMVNRHVQLLKETDDGWAVLPLTGLHACEALHDRITNEGAVFEAIVEPSVAESFQSNPDYAELIGEMVATGRHDIYVYDGEIPYFVGVFDETVQMGVDEGGEPRALLETDSPAVSDWADGKYEEYKQQSRKVT